MSVPHVQALRWQCPECKGYWPASADECPWCRWDTGQHIRSPLAAGRDSTSEEGQQQ